VVAQDQLGLVEAVEALEDQQGQRLAEIERRLAHRAEQVAGVEFGDLRVDPRHVLRRHHHGRLGGPGELGQVEPGESVGGVRGADQPGMRGGRRPAGHVGGAKVGRVELGAGHLGDAVDPAHAVDGGIPAAGRHRLAGVEGCRRGHGEPGQAQRDAARGDELDEFAPRRLHAPPLHGFLERPDTAGRTQLAGVRQSANRL
jgi:hypothetical protein